MKNIQVFFFPLLVILFLIAGCNSQEDYKDKLRQKGIEFTQARFFQVIKNGDKDTVQQFIKAGMPVNSYDDNGTTPLIWALINQNGDTAKLLLENGADYRQESMDKKRITPLLVAVGFGLTPIVQYILDKGVDVNALVTNEQVPVLMAACTNIGNKETLELLIKKGANVNARAFDGDTPYMIAILNGRKDLAELLTANGADPDARDNKGRNASELLALKLSNQPF